MFGIKSVRYPASIANICHMYCYHIQNMYRVSADILDIGIFLLPYIDTGRAPLK